MTREQAKLFKLRKEVHDILDPLWRSGTMQRMGVYRLLSRYMGKPLWKTHARMFNIKECKRAISILLMIRNGGLRNRRRYRI